MTLESKRAEIRFEADKPMRFVDLEDDQAVAEWAPEQRDLASAVMAALKAYVQTVEMLTKDRYKHLRDKLPAHMAEPGSIFAVICSDGVVVRYERKSEGPRRVAVAAMSAGVESAAAMLSQNLIHIATSAAPFPPENFGVTLTLSLVSPTSPDASRDLFNHRICFQSRMPTEPRPALSEAKPYCLLSVRNEMVFLLHGEIPNSSDPEGPRQPFIARSAMRLLAGWDCIEVFTGTAVDAWNADRVPIWAEHDILGAVLISQTTESQLNTLDPRAAARRRYAAVLKGYKEPLDSSPEHEQMLQAFLEQHPYLLCPSQQRMWPKLRLGNLVTDFVFRDAQQDYLLVEIEHPDRPLFRQDGAATAELTHAQNQVLDWKRYIEDNLSTVQRELGLHGITSNPDALVVIGRSSALTDNNRRKLQAMATQTPKLRVVTYDDVYASAKAIFENLLGPMWDAGGETEIYYPTPSATPNPPR